MNYELAIMALDGLTRSPMSIAAGATEVVVEADAASFRELARLCLLLGGLEQGAEDGFELKPGVHVSDDSPLLRLRLRQS